MSLTLGEKLRQAREERGISISEVAEQTRISSHYLESIENDDYRPLPGGIFNKGFVKSYAKFVDLDEQEALEDYARAIMQPDGSAEEPMKVYRPEVLTDDRSGSSMIPTVIVAVVILGLMTVGVYYFVDWVQNRPVSTPPAANANANAPANANTAASQPKAPEFSTAKFEFKALNAPVSLTAVSDGKTSSNVVPVGSTSVFEPKESLKLTYSKSLATNVQLTINGKAITLPAQPLQPKRATIEFEINKDNFAQIWQSGAISTEVPAAVPDANANVQATPPPATVAAPVPKPSVAANTANTVRPTPIKVSPTPKPATIVVPSANRPG